MKIYCFAFFCAACSGEKNPSSTVKSNSVESNAVSSSVDASKASETPESKPPVSGEQEPIQPPPQGMNDVQPPPLGNNATGVRMDLSVMRPQFSTSEIGESVTISGVLSGDCSGNIRIDAAENDLQIPEGEPLPGPLVAISPSSVGEFSLPVPKGKSISLIAFCDQDKDQKIETSVDLGSAPKNLGILQEDLSDVEIKLTAISDLVQQKLPPIDKENLPSIEPHPQD